MIVSIDGKNLEAEASVLTLVIYEQEFQADLIKDLFGKVKIEVPEDDESTLDFTLTDWSKLPKVVWAMLKTADSKTPRYSEWARKTKGVNLFELNEQVGDAVVDAFFRPTATAEEKN